MSQEKKLPEPFQRGLKKEVVKELQAGCLQPIIAKIEKHNKSEMDKEEEKRQFVSFNIRKNYANIYCDGGSLGRLVFQQTQTKWEWNSNYYFNITDEESKKAITDCAKTLGIETPNPELRKEGKKFNPIKAFIFKNKVEVEDFLNKNWENLIKIMNARAKNTDERKFQQNVEFYNNKEDNNFYIIDIEYALGKGATGKNANLDMLAIEKNDNGNYNLILVENKVGSASSSGKSGIADHIRDFTDLMESDKVDKFIKNAQEIANQLIDLELINGLNEHITIENKTPIKVVFPMLNYWKSNSNDTSGAIKNGLEDFNKVSNNKDLLDIEFLFLGNFEGNKIINKFLYKNDKHLIKASEIHKIYNDIDKVSDKILKENLEAFKELAK